MYVAALYLSDETVSGGGECDCLDAADAGGRGELLHYREVSPCHHAQVSPLQEKSRMISLRGAGEILKINENRKLFINFSAPHLITLYIDHSSLSSATFLFHYN